ncbi:FecR family protein [Wenyingzhuangia sp. 1_MG-2023]|nr:FecR family protein [Wenyingzhuangia sp. 1_MG-2023]
MKLLEAYKEKVQNGTATQKELQDFLKLIEDAKNKNLENWLKQKWEVAEHANFSDDVKKQIIWGKISKQLNVSITNKKIKGKVRKLNVYKYIAVASIVLIVGISYLFTTHTTSTDFITLTVKRGELAKMFTLPDSTKIWLNSASTLTYQNNFVSNRNLKLDGEAYFEVHKNKKSPFKVLFSDNQLKVTGTKFNISSYQNENHVLVHVKEGSVEVYNQRVDTTFLTQNHLLFINKSSNRQNKSIVEFNDDKLWNKEKLVFKKSKLSQVLKVLERRYDVIFDYDKTNINESSLLTVQYQNTMTIDEVLKGLEILTNLKYEKVNEHRIKIN